MNKIENAFCDLMDLLAPTQKNAIEEGKKPFDILQKVKQIIDQVQDHFEVKVGDRFKHKTGEEFILARLNSNEVSLISLEDGNRWSAPQNCSSPMSYYEFSQVCDGQQREFVKLPRKTKKIAAECHSDDFIVKVDFDALKWFEEASDKEIVALAKCGWGGDYPADAVAEFMELHNENVASMFQHIENNGPNCGYECRILDIKAAQDWIKENRPNLVNDKQYHLVIWGN